ncbi:PREDICTED: indole-3-acetaldehyde oxidase-like [Papilio polytes]|uniref:indole-3-acetaldehyde oxidase-like n=1 Tax=Papilio polytes TaxID=76194 RepID=UPI000676A18C|nr:PREDICTED: indole-3-acetaldehyde oxidase-like [Papilio polytes]
MDKIYFSVNGQRYTLSGPEVNETTSLNDYLRSTLGLFGSKSMCHEGGCGTCIVSVAQYNPNTKGKDVFAVNSCLVHILSCHTWEITTIEGLGNQRDGYHPLQSRLATFNGTQCGYCTPGWIMNMYSLYKGSSKKLTTQEIERSFGGNMCRCTGYRPILDSFKSFANDTDPQIKDLEDLDQMKCLKSDDCLLDEEWCVIEGMKELKLQGSKSNRWYKAFTLQDVFKILTREGVDSYRLVAGNTGKGVYPIEADPRIHIDISSIECLKDITRSVNLVLGSGISLTEMMRVFKFHAKNNVDFQYLEHFYEHLELVAHIPVRNIGTIGGNLALKNAHNEFPSDIFLLLQTVEGMVTVVDNNLRNTDVSMSDFLKLDLRNKLILNVKLPPLTSDIIIKTYKIMPRAQNAHAIVNAGFQFQLDSSVVTSCCLVFGNISPDFIRARETENILKGKNLYADVTLQKALSKLNQEIVPKDFPPEPSVHCRKAIALGLFYKAILSKAPSVNPRYKSGGSLLDRPVSTGTQHFDTNKSLWPLNQPVQKLEALTQCSGEVRYSCDIRFSPRDVHVAFVLATEAVADIKTIDATEALKLPGVIAFFSAKDIPGNNSFTPLDVPWQNVVEEILASKRVLYYGQPIGLMVADNQKLAVKAAKLVHVKYKKIADPVLTVSDVLVAPDKDKRVCMIGINCIISVEVSVPRVGGGYGAKASRSAQVACACALAAHLLRRPAHLVMPLTHNMLALGKRCACLFQYEVGVNDFGVIQYLNLTFYSDCGCSYNDSQGDFIGESLVNLYNSSRFNITGYSVLTDKASTTWCRAPATTEAAAIMEHIMERIAHATNKDPIDVRIANLAPKNDPLKEMIATFKMETNYDDRKSEIAEYNQRNAWKKRALKLSIMSFQIGYSGNYPVTISVYHGDGSVLISHGGVEMGQGINTKVAQVCAYTLGIPLDKVQVKGTDSFVSPNSMATNGSITSECVAYATLKACRELLKRLEPAKKGMKEPTWEQIVKKSYDNNVNLQTNSMTSPLDGLLGYDVYGVCCTEVCLDVLTAQHQVLRVDILEDTGQSISPNLDIGQIEGAFVMGLGLWTREQLQYAGSGRLLTDRFAMFSFTVISALTQANVILVRFFIVTATGEPALVLAVSVTLALHEALLEGRKEFGYVDKEWLHVDTPYTIENIIKAISPKIESFKLQ